MTEVSIERSFIEELSRRSHLRIVACESGGASILAAIVSRLSLPLERLTFSLDGPALKVFKDIAPKSAIHPSSNITSLIVEDNPLVLTGSSWMPDWERDAIGHAKDASLEVWSVLDHWTNFRERFVPASDWNIQGLDWKYHLPDKVLVCDDYAMGIALDENFPPNILKRIPNYALMDFKKKIDSARHEAPSRPKSDGSFHLLYISEPIADDLKVTYGTSDYWGYTEFTLLEDVLKAKPENITLRVRLHPNETSGKYAAILSKTSNVEISHGNELINDLSWSDSVVGAHSMALALALEAGLPTISYIPKNATKQCVLPHKEICKVNSPKKIFDQLKR